MSNLIIQSMTKNDTKTLEIELEYQKTVWVKDTIHVKVPHNIDTSSYVKNKEFYNEHESAIKVVKSEEDSGTVETADTVNVLAYKIIE
jgi:hypothetical protein